MKAPPMLNPFERAAIDAYQRGEYRYLLECPDKEHLDTALDDSVDPLFAFIMRELSTEEDCETIDDAIMRMTTAQADVATILQALRRLKRPLSASPEHRVTWTIDLSADTPRDAARRALEIQRDPASIATVFTVYEQRTGNTQTIDLGGTHEKTE